MRFIFFLFCYSIHFGFSLVTANAINVVELTTYPQLCEQAVIDQTTFQNFKRHPSNIFTLSKQEGWKYLTYICDRYPHLMDSFDLCRSNDAIGNPILRKYDQFGWFSPETVKYIKIAGDLENEFGSLKNLHIVEVGGGYGGLCKILHELGGFASYTIVNLPSCNKLTKKYLEAQGVPNVQFVDIKNLQEIPFSDLVISDHTFSEMDSQEQLTYLQELFYKTPNGYLNLNETSAQYGLQSLSANQIVSCLYRAGKQGKLCEETPQSPPHNVTITWRDVRGLTIYREIPKETETFNFAKNLQTTNAITYSALVVGRLGDQLIAYLHAKWISYKYSIPLLFVPFENSECFSCHFQESQKGNLIFKQTKRFSSKTKLELIFNSQSTLFDMPFIPEHRHEYQRIELKPRTPSYLWIDWEDPYFKKIIRKCLQIIVPTQSFNLPKDKITVAVHVRKGGGHDDPNTAPARWPVKFPDDNYYIQQIQTLAEVFKEQPLYVYIFTDDQNPLAILNYYKAMINNPNIEFACRQTENGPELNVIDDFVMLTKFDCLIRSASHFSFVASRLKDYKIEISPGWPTKVNDKYKIERIKLVFKP